jgi:branched-chain amino acid aminotransferase
MPSIPEDLFLQAVKTAINNNLAFVPPYGTGGSMYICPLVFGSGLRIDLQPTDEYIFLVMVLPVADYYKGGMKPVPAVVVDDFDRAAPRGVGDVKVIDNYAADLLPNVLYKKKGFPIGLYLDAKTNTFVKEFSTSNFFATSGDGRYVTPNSFGVDRQQELGGDRRR